MTKRRLESPEASPAAKKARTRSPEPMEAMVESSGPREVDRKLKLSADVLEAERTVDESTEESSPVEDMGNLSLTAPASSAESVESPSPTTPSPSVEAAEGPSPTIPSPSVEAAENSSPTATPSLTKAVEGSFPFLSPLSEEAAESSSPTAASSPAEAVEGSSPLASSPSTECVGSVSLDAPTQVQEPLDDNKDSDGTRKRSEDDLERSEPAKKTKRAEKAKTKCQLPSPLSSSSPADKPLPPPASAETPPSVPNLPSPSRADRSRDEDDNSEEPPVSPVQSTCELAVDGNDQGTADGRQQPSERARLADTPASRVYRKVLGLKNYSNMCYHNSVIQCLAHTKPIRDRFMIAESEKERRTRVEAEECLSTTGRTMTGAAEAAIKEAARAYKDVKKEDVHLSTALGKVLGQLAAGDPHQSCVLPVDYCQAYAAIYGEQYDGFQPQDANEALFGVLQRLTKEETRDSGSPITVVDSTFAGTVIDNLICETCGKLGDANLAISVGFGVNIPEPHYPDQAFALSECLDLFFNWPESVERRCPHCPAKLATKIPAILEIPDHLAFEIRRWRTEWDSTGKRLAGKDNSDIEFPLGDFNLAPWMADPQAAAIAGKFFECYALIEHFGTSQYNGHYIAYVKRDDGWWRMNDEWVKRVTPDEVQQANPYILFYRKEE